MAHWAEVSVTEQFQLVPLDDQTTSETQDQIEVKCPMCRTLTLSSPNKEREVALRQRYPRMYAARKKEEEEEEDGDRTADVVTMVLYVGNTHQYKPPAVETSDQENAHEWTFFVRPGETDLIAYVKFGLVCLSLLFVKHFHFRAEPHVLSIQHFTLRELSSGERRMRSIDWVGALLRSLHR
jgi:hypothetical protein